MRIKRIVEYTLRRVVCAVKEAGSSRSCAARDGSARWMSPRVAVLTGVEAPSATTSVRGWNEEDVLLLCVYSDRWRSDYVLVVIDIVHR